MTGCCGPADYAGVFSARRARRDARAYRRHGLRGSAATLAGWLRPHAGSAAVLEVGGGVGALQLELLAAGAARATNVELSPEYEEAAQELAGADGRIERRIGDFVTSTDIAPADLVVLHRVVCCYPDGRAMVEKAAATTTHALAMTYPRNTWWNRALFKAGNALLSLTRSSFRAYVHDPHEMLETAAQHDLSPDQHDQGPFWESVLLRRRS